MGAASWARVLALQGSIRQRTWIVRALYSFASVERNMLFLLWYITLIASYMRTMFSPKSKILIYYGAATV